MNYFGIDIGGTNLRIAQVDPKTGKLVSKVHRFAFSNIKSNEELSKLVFSILPKTNNYVVSISIAAKIDLDKQEILKCMNNQIYIQYGKFEFINELKIKKIKTFILNDVLSASLGYLYFKKKDIKNYVVLTSSTGFNACPIFNGKFFATPELGMIDFNSYFGLKKELLKSHLIKYGIDYVPLGMFLSGLLYKIYPAEYFKKNSIDKKNELIKLTIEYLQENKLPLTDENILNNFNPKNAVKAFSINPAQSPQKELIEATRQSLETVLFILVSAYSPLDEIVFIGSMTKDWNILFKYPIDKFNERMRNLIIKRPSIKKAHTPELGIRGAVYFAYNYNKLK